MNFLYRFFYTPHTTTLHIDSPHGFHLRPIARFATEAKQFSSEIEASFNHKKVDAKAVNALLSLGLEEGDHFTLKIRGKDAKRALHHLETIFLDLMHQERQKENHPLPLQKKVPTYEGEVCSGESISRGIAIAPAFFSQTAIYLGKKHISFTQALSQSLEALEQCYQRDKGTERAEICLAQKALLGAISHNIDSLEALEVAIEEASSQLRGGKMEAKRIDYKDILQRVKQQMGIETKMHLPKTDAILMAEELLPSQIEQLKESTVKGVVLKQTSPTSHTAILLRASGIPSLIANYVTVSEGDMVILDAESGVLVTTPSKHDIQMADTMAKEHLAQVHIAAKKRFETAETQEKKPIGVFANVTDIASAKCAKEEGAEGIGLLRTEFLFTEKAPTLKEQQAAYETIFALFDDITIRTLDIGGDKQLPYLTLPRESNPFLGIRGVRLFNTHPEIMEAQLHAIFAAAKGRALKVMFPMVSTVEEFTAAKAFSLNVAKKYALSVEAIQFGIMVEVPSVLFLMPSFNRVVDFYSIGSNDLIQYLFAIERTHPSLKVEPHSSVIYDAIRTIVEQAKKPVSICGELAGDKDAIGRLIALGIERVSVSPRHIATIKEEIRHV